MAWGRDGRESVAYRHTLKLYHNNRKKVLPLIIIRINHRYYTRQIYSRHSQWASISRCALEIFSLSFGV